MWMPSISVVWSHCILCKSTGPVWDGAVSNVSASASTADHLPFIQITSMRYHQDLEVAIRPPVTCMRSDQLLMTSCIDRRVETGSSWA